MYFFPAVLCADQSGRTQCRALAQSRNQVSLLKKIYSWQLHTHNYHRYVRQNYDIRELARRQTLSCDAASFASVFRLVFFQSTLEAECGKKDTCLMGSSLLLLRMCPSSLARLFM